MNDMYYTDGTDFAEMTLNTGRKKSLSRYMLAMFALVGSAGCSLSDLVGEGDVPIGTPQPGIIANAEGAISAYYGSVASFESIYGGRQVTGNGAPFIIVSGLLTDELSALTATGGDLSLNSFTAIDARILPEHLTTPVGTTTHATYSELFSKLQVTRNLAGEAIASLRKYAPDANPAYLAHAYAVKAYAQIMLADVFCSGIPLSKLIFEGDVEHGSGSSVNEVYESAVALFDTAISLSADSARILNLASVGKGRALVALGRYSEAALAVKDVPDTYEYVAQYSSTYSFPNYLNVFFTGTTAPTVGLPYNLTVANNKGINGLDFVSSDDPRVPTFAVTGTTKFFPAKFSGLGNTPLRVASGIEARLIEAEADLSADNPRWLTTLNSLRTTCTDPANCATPAPIGAGGTAGLSPLTAPVAKQDQIALLFRERGYWLYLGGHRQGDFRRLVRVYGMDSRSVYPTGVYSGASSTFGDDYNAPIPANEIETNPKIQGCMNRHD